MNDTPDPLLSEPDMTVSEMTFDVPSILLEAKIENGQVFHSVREGRAQQVQLTTTIEWTEAPADERESLFVIRAQNLINFAQQRISVINDDTTLGDKHFPPSSPTASEYLAKIGKPVLIHFDCARDATESKRLGRPVYKIVRNTIILP